MNFTIVMTEKCNLRCSYCYEKKRDNNAHMDLECQTRALNFIVKCIEEEEKKGIFCKHRVLLHGGEPLLNFGALKFFVNKLINIFPNKVIFEMTTNGTIYNKEIFDFIDSNFESISISMDGGYVSHNKYRLFENGEGSFNIVKDNLKKIFETHSIFVRCRMTLHKKRIKFLYSDCVSLIKTGFKIISISHDFYDEWEWDDYNVVMKELVKLKNFIREKKIDVRVSLLDEYGLFQKKSSCFGGVTSFCISASGDIYPCIYSLGNDEHKIGSVYKHELDKDRIIKFLNLNKDNELCEGCERIKYCDGNRCKILNYSVTGDYFIPDGSNCLFEKLVTNLLLEEGDDNGKHKDINN